MYTSPRWCLLSQSPQRANCPQWQYRFAVQGRILEFPAGTVEPNEDPAETIKREIEEETAKPSGGKTRRIFPAPGYLDEIIYAFLAQDLERLDMPPSQDADEDIETVLLTPQELEQAILTVNQ